MVKLDVKDLEPKIGLVFTNFNNSGYTEKLLDSLKSVSHILDVVIVDNNSAPEERSTLRKLEDKFSDFVAISFLKFNVGYFQGLNHGLSILRNRKENYRFFIVGNNDLVFDSRLEVEASTIEKLCQEHLIISPAIVSSEGNHQNPHVRSRLSFLRKCLHDLYYVNYLVGGLLRLGKLVSGSAFDRADEESHSHAGPIEQGYGACYIVSNRFYSHFDSLFAPTFLMHEEYFLSYQLKSKGFNVFYSPVLEVRHIGKVSTGKVPSLAMYQLSKASHLLTRVFK